MQFLGFQLSSMSMSLDADGFREHTFPTSTENRSHTFSLKKDMISGLPPALLLWSTLLFLSLRKRSTVCILPSCIFSKTFLFFSTEKFSRSTASLRAVAPSLTWTFFIFSAVSVTVTVLLLFPFLTQFWTSKWSLTLFGFTTVSFLFTLSTPTILKEMFQTDRSDVVILSSSMRF